MASHLFTRRNFAARVASFVSGLGVATALSGATANAQEAGGVRKLGYEGKPADGTQMITPLVINNGLIYIAGQGANSHNEGELPIDLATHTTKVLERGKTLGQ